jgi:hypothetical protein
MIIVKCTSTGGDFAVYHRSNTGAPETDYLRLNTAGATADDATFWNDTAPTDSVFTVGTNAAVNTNTATYVAYLFAHDTSDDGVIQCGSYTGNGSASGPTVTLGWEPQFILLKQSTGSGNWYIVDNARGFTTSDDKPLRPNLSDAEMGVQGTFQATATGFTINQSFTAYNASGQTYIYMAIRAEGA